MLRNALSRYTSSPPAGGAVSLRLMSVAVPQAELRFSVSPGDRFIAAPLLRSPRGEAKVGSCRAARRANRFCPEYGNFLRCVPHLCRIPLPACPFPGGLGGRSRIEFIVSPLSRRRHNESHFAAQSPECAFLAKPFFAQAKNGVNLRRYSHKISVDKAKTNRSHHQITVTPAPRSDSLPFPYTAAWLSELCVVSDPPAG